MKERIIGCTLAQCRALGLRQLTMDAIASELRISKRTLYVHFPSKEQLLEACLKTWLAQNRLMVTTGGNLIDELCTLYGSLQRIDLPRTVRCCSELRECCLPVYECFLKQMCTYAEACGARVGEDAEAGYICHDVTARTVCAVLSDYLIRLFGNADARRVHREYLLSPDMLVVFARGLCTIKGRAYLERQLKSLA